MAGHSKWAQIKHKKAVTDSRKGVAYTKLANAISVAAKNGADPEKNFQLRLAIQKAKDANMPNSNIERSIQRGSGQLGGAQIEEVIYEGYCPGGVAVIVEAATDNRNRTAAEVRSVFAKHGGSLGSPGSVAFQFEQKGQLFIKTNDQEQAALDAIEAGAEDVFEEEDGVRVYATPVNFEQVKNALEQNFRLKETELVLAPKQTVRIDEPAVAQKVVRLLEGLEEIDDVTATHSNIDLAPEVLEKVAT